MLGKAANLLEAGNISAAQNILQEAVIAAPADAAALHQLAIVCAQRGEHPAALELYQRIIRLMPDNRQALLLLGVEYAETGNYEQAVDCFLSCLKRDPENPTFLRMTGIAYTELGKFDEAYQYFTSAIGINPEDDTALTHLAIVLINKLRMTEAEGHLLKALSVNRENALAYNNLGRVYKFQGRSGEAVAAFRRALELEPHNFVVVNNLLLCINYLPDMSPEEVFSEHRKLCEQVYGTVDREHSQARAERTDRRIRVGYVSGDFHNHSVSFFFEPILMNYDHQKFSVYCYSNDTREDDTTRRLKSLNAEWRSIAGLSGKQASEMVQADGVDILIDLSGHSSENRLDLFALKPAPIQASWLGYPHSTGMRQIDYYLTDGQCDPPGMTDHLYTEKLVRLPKTFCCYLPPINFPVVSPRPAANSGVVTFGSFNNFAKVNGKLIEVWSELLRRVPDSRLFLKSMALGDSETQQSVLAAFQKQGISADRIALLSIVKSAVDHLALYTQIDIALDTFPYHGTTTTCEALWMGVPVITQAGTTHASRVGVSLLTAVGCPELIAETADDYIKRVVELANDFDRLRYYRENLRTMMAKSPLMDADGMTRKLEMAYQTMMTNSVGI